MPLKYPKIGLGDFEMLDTLGTGSFGRVRLVKFLQAQPSDCHSTDEALDAARARNGERDGKSTSLPAARGDVVDGLSLATRESNGQAASGGRCEK